MSFATDLQAELDRLRAAGWTRDQIAATTGYTDRQIRSWANGAECKPALQLGIIITLSALIGPPETKSK